MKGKRVGKLFFVRVWKVSLKRDILRMMKQKVSSVANLCTEWYFHFFRLILSLFRPFELKVTHKYIFCNFSCVKKCQFCKRNQIELYVSFYFFLFPFPCKIFHLSEDYSCFVTARKVFFKIQRHRKFTSARDATWNWRGKCESRMLSIINSIYFLLFRERKNQ